MATRSSKIPEAAYRYFASVGIVGEHPTIEAVFTPGRGWRRAPWSGPKAVSVSAIRKLRAEGATVFALGAGGRVADFSARELVGGRR